MECGRTLGIHIARGRRSRRAEEARLHREVHPEDLEALQQILEFDDKERDRTTAQLTDILNRSRNL